MKLSRACGYAVQGLVLLAVREPGRLVPSHELARAEGMPERFLLKVFKPLVSARILLSVRGPHGGYRLARPAKSITLLEVVEAIDGLVRGDAPAVERAGDGKFDRRLQAVCDGVAEVVRKHLRRVSVAELAGKGK
jgi:Rrf2 family protein